MPDQYDDTVANFLLTPGSNDHTSGERRSSEISSSMSKPKLMTKKTRKRRAMTMFQMRPIQTISSNPPPPISTTVAIVSST